MHRRNFRQLVVVLLVVIATAVIIHAALLTIARHQSRVLIDELVRRGAIFADKDGNQVTNNRVDGVAIVDLGRLTSFTNDDLSTAVTLFPNLESIWLHGSGIDDASITILGRAQNLKGVFISDSSVTTAGARRLAAIGSLRELTVFDENVDDEFLAALADCRLLEALTLRYCTATLRTLPSNWLPRLRFIHLFECPNVTPKCIARILELPELCELRLYLLRCDLDQAFGTRHVPTLRRLEIRFCRFTDRGAAQLEMFPHLSDVTILGTSMGAQGGEHIARLPLTRLEVGELGCDPAFLRCLRKSAGLKVLAIACEDALRPDAVAALGELTMLQTLIVHGGKKISPEVMAQLQAALPQAKIVW
jgi:hypothetical protein